METALEATGREGKAALSIDSRTRTEQSLGSGTGTEEHVALYGGQGRKGIATECSFLLANNRRGCITVRAQTNRSLIRVDSRRFGDHSSWPEPMMIAFPAGRPVGSDLNYRFSKEADRYSEGIDTAVTFEFRVAVA
jgi:hypothetical protein